MRLCDTDALGHVNNAKYVYLATEAVHAAMQARQPVPDVYETVEQLEQATTLVCCAVLLRNTRQRWMHPSQRTTSSEEFDVVLVLSSPKCIAHDIKCRVILTRSRCCSAIFLNTCCYFIFIEETENLIPVLSRWTMHSIGNTFDCNCLGFVVRQYVDYSGQMKPGDTYTCAVETSRDHIHCDFDLVTLSCGPTSDVFTPWVTDFVQCRIAFSASFACSMYTMEENCGVKFQIPNLETSIARRSILLAA